MDLLSYIKEYFEEVVKEISQDFGGNAAFSSPATKPKKYCGYVEPGVLQNAK
jgi:hypothetical protein